jgi:hypothetical protein
MADPQTQSGITPGFHLAIRGSRCYASRHRSRLSLPFRPLGGLSKQHPTGRDHVILCPDPSGQLADPQASRLAVAVHRSTTDPVDPAHLNKQLCQHMVRL